MSKGQNTAQPGIEALESRWCLSSAPWATLGAEPPDAPEVRLRSNGTLHIQGDAANNEISISQDNNNITVNIDGEVYTFSHDNVRSLSIHGQNGNDLIENQSNLDAVINGGSGNDVILGGSGNDVLLGGAGNDILTDIGGTQNTLDGGSGDDNLWALSGNGRDSLQGGSGNDTLYAIVGGTNTSDGGLGDDIMIVRGTDNITTDSGDTVVQFQDRGRDVALSNGILYVMGGGNIAIVESGDQLMVQTNGETHSFNRADVNFIAGIGDPVRDDVFINMSSVGSVYYGAGGNDMLVGGRSGDILKGGSGVDMIWGGGGNDDISGDGGNDVVMGAQGNDIIRTDGNDLLFTDAGDQIIGSQQSHSARQMALRLTTSRLKRE